MDAGGWTSLNKWRETVFVSITAPGASHYVLCFCWRSIYTLRCTVSTLLVHEEESSPCITRIGIHLQPCKRRYNKMHGKTTATLNSKVFDKASLLTIAQMLLCTLTDERNNYNTPQVYFIRTRLTYKFTFFFEISFKQLDSSQALRSRGCIYI